VLPILLPRVFTTNMASPRWVYVKAIIPIIERTLY